jgi:hypothetical protein
MNLSLARQHYSMTKESKIDGPTQNALAIKLSHGTAREFLEDALDR